MGEKGRQRQATDKHFIYMYTRMYIRMHDDPGTLDT